MDSKVDKEEEWEAFKEKWKHEFPDVTALREDFEFLWKKLVLRERTLEGEDSGERILE